MRGMGYLKYFEFLSDLDAYVKRTKESYKSVGVAVTGVHIYVANSTRGFWAVEMEMKNML